jgi:response regulator of citrate/malate metabolism
MKSIRVLIVEDDFMVADINKAFTENVPGFEVAMVANTGRQALAWLESNSVDLVVLDVYLPDIHGLDLLKKLRKNDYPADFILITAAHDSPMIEESMRFGVFDYIIKPFDGERYTESLLGYKRRRESLGAGRSLNQASVDQALSNRAAAKSGMTQAKGINPETMKKVKAAIENLDAEFGIDELSNALSISRITAHRYLESLVQCGVLGKEFRYSKVGRPAARYSLLPTIGR